VLDLDDRPSHADVVEADCSFPEPTGDTFCFPKEHPRMRVGRYHIEMARAYVEMGRTEAALKSLHLARTVAPQQARYHPLMRETIGALVRRQRMASESLASLAAWVGM